MSDPLYERAQEAADAIRATVNVIPRIAVVLGSGMGPLADRLTDAVMMPYANIPHFPIPTVPGHHGNLVAGRLGSVPILVLQGRFHYYEGHPLDDVTFPIRVLQRLGISTLILTAASGGIDPDLRPGDIVCLTDHINLLASNPLRGPNDDRLGIRFPDMSHVYSAHLSTIAAEEAGRIGFPLFSGVYACVPGPSYETPAEIRMLRALGAHVVGMSTAPEAIVARHAGMEVLGLALVSNAAAGVSSLPVSHEEVLQAGREATPRIGELIEAVVGRAGAA
jgi:purine-nucleoside phosphorylase